MSTSISVGGEGVIVNVADLRLMNVRNVSDNEHLIELHFKGVRDPFRIDFWSNKDERDKVFRQIQEKMLALR